MLSGYKTYIVGALGIISAIAAYLVGDATLAQAGQAVLSALLAMTVRHGIGKK